MLNPFVEFARDPVGVLAIVGYALFLTSLILASTWWSVRTMAKLYVRYDKNKHTDRWWSGPMDIGMIPPPEWSISASAVILVWSITAWAVSGLIWVVSG